MIRHILALMATVILAGCGMATNLRGPAELGVPEAIGDWTVSNVTSIPGTDFGNTMAEFASVFLEAAGATSTTGTWATFEVRDGGVLVTRVDAFRVIGAGPEAMWRGADAIGFGDAAIEGTTPAGWDLRRMGDGSGWIAVRNDRLFTFSGGPPGPTSGQVQRFLESLK